MIQNDSFRIIGEMYNWPLSMFDYIENPVKPTYEVY